MKNETGVLTAIRQLEEKLLQQNVRKSESDVYALLADDFIEYTSSGHIADKNKTIQGLLNEQPSQITLSDFKARFLAPNIVLATYRAVKTESDGKKSCSLRSSIWKMIDDSWQLVFHQGTSIES